MVRQRRQFLGARLGFILDVTYEYFHIEKDSILLITVDVK